MTQTSSDATPSSKTDWQTLPPEHLPGPSYWPAVLALGIAFLFWGFVTSVIISAVGAVLFVIGLGGWIGALCHAD